MSRDINCIASLRQSGGTGKTMAVALCMIDVGFLLSEVSSSATQITVSDAEIRCTSVSLSTW